MSHFLDLKSNAFGLGAAIEKLGVDLTSTQYGPARDAFRDIRDTLLGSVRRTMDAQAFVPLSPVTREYKERKGLDSRTLFATGNTYSGLDGIYGGTFAKVMRGEAEWYIFLHDRGRGYGPWSREGWVTKKSGARKAGWKRRHRSAEENGPVPGVTHFPQRQAFVITESAESSVLSRFDLFLQTACDEVGDASA